ncbi:hypothetical protein ANCCAN_00279 [Ancylostoma caninum]|uniref:Uncharacterized protein n=1 Tax=Ancylostoma caninum TaxID=29170 RepID=A0A368HEZ1_ANCCA|nr:hypothetical protein ANCCAN_00279 [Ancylostoma caninum]
MHIAASTLPNGVRELVLIATAPLYHVRVCFLGATVYVEFGDKIVQIDGDYTSINVFTDKYSIIARTNTTPYDVSLTKEEILVRCPNESTLLRVLPSGVDVNVEQLNKLQIDRGGGELSLGSAVTAMSTDLNLDNSGRVTANTLNSHISVQTAVQNVGMTAAHHVIRVEGGAPHIIVESGRACIEVKASHGLPQLEDLLSPFVTPADQFANIGPDQAAQLTTPSQDFAEPSFPRPGDLGGPLVLFNGSDRCAACINQTTIFPSTKLPSSLIPTFPTTTSIDYIPHTEVSLSTASETFPTLISLQSDSSTTPTSAPAVTTAKFPTPSKTLSPSSKPSVTQPTVTETSKPFPSPEELTTVAEATMPTSKVGTESQEAGTTATTTLSGSTSDQFVIGQFSEFPSDGSSSSTTMARPSKFHSFFFFRYFHF